MNEADRYRMIHPDTSAYAYSGGRTDPYNDLYRAGGRVVDNYNDWEVEDFNFDPDGYDMTEDYLSKQTSLPFDGYQPGTPYDSIFGLGKKRQLKKAEKKIAKAEKKLEQGNTKAAARKLKKGTAILTKIQEQQGVAATAQQQIADTRAGQEQLALNAQQLANPIQPLSVAPMSEIGSSIGSSGGGYAETSGNIGADSSAPSTALNPDEPTGWLAEEKELGGVTVVGKKQGKPPIVLILIAAVVLIAAIIYFSKKKGK